jgi:hypothetical protein
MQRLLQSGNIKKPNVGTTIIYLKFWSYHIVELTILHQIYSFNREQYEANNFKLEH